MAKKKWWQSDKWIDALFDSFEEANKGLEIEELLAVLNNNLTINWLAEVLWLKETSVMSELRLELVKLMINWGEIKSWFILYEDLAIEIINEKKGVDYSKWQIALMLLKARIAYDGNDMDYYKSCIDDASEYAYQAGFDAIDGNIQKIKKKFPLK